MNTALAISAYTRTFRLPAPLLLESGGRLEGVEVAYRTWGNLADDGGNAVVICHGLTGSADADQWWAGLFGRGRACDPTRDFIICTNVLGGCYGTTGPRSIPGGSDGTGGPRSSPGGAHESSGATPISGGYEGASGSATKADRGGGTYGPDFPHITIRDMVRLQMSLLDALGVRRIRLVLGGSLGGMQTLEWALLDPERVSAIAPMCASARHSPWCIGWSEVQRTAIFSDPSWKDGWYSPERPPARGLAIARMAALCTYRSSGVFEQRFGRRTAEDQRFEVEKYLHYQGGKLVERFDANCYVTLTRAMDAHDVGAGRGGCDRVLRSIARPALIVSVESDLLYPPAEQEKLARFIPRATLARIDSPHGHDGFLIESAAVNDAVVAFRQELEG